MKKMNLPKPVHQVLQTLATTLQAARKAKAMRQQDLASRIGVTRQTIARMEQGDATVAIAVYLVASWILNIPLLPGLENVDTRTQEGLGQIIQFLQKQLPVRITRKKEKEIDDNF